MTIFFTSDWHLGHDKPFVWQARGFPSMESHDSYLIKNWQETVSRYDDVYIVGDFMMGKDKIQRATELLGSLQFRTVTWVLGNHDPKPGPLKEAFKGTNVTIVPMGDEFVFGTDSFWYVSHLPYAGTQHAVHGKDERPLPFPEDKGFPLLHGHTHSTHVFSRGPARGLQVHVGVDAHAGLVSYDALIKLTEGMS